ncbi:glycosyltransferase family 2 protein [Rhodovulum sp. DZ06]|uniref:glycosyltransferase family 2 protein n=1 Tax=Rhodovulum sp. DZ06 TaxID=3425126 RepID=UPI003D355706
MSAPPIPPVAEPEAPRPLVSVVTAAFNVRAGVVRTAESVAAQALGAGGPGAVEAGAVEPGAVEHVVIDGGSTDGTAEWLAGREGIRWISEPDGGIADAMNKGAALARGEWILFLHAGDLFDGPDALARVVPALHAAAAAGEQIVSCDVAIGPERRPYRATGLWLKTELKTTIPHQGAFCRRALFERIGGFDGGWRVAMDYEFFLRAMRAGARCRLPGGVLATMDDGGVSSRRDWPSVARRLGEERRIHALHRPGAGGLRRAWVAALHAAWWPPYLLYRRLKAWRAARG